MDPLGATAAVTRRYLAAYGPATYNDLARWWSGGGVSTAQQWVTSLGEEGSPLDLDGVQAWMLAPHTREASELPPTRSVRLLAAFDQYVVAASCHAERLLPGDLRGRVYRSQGWISPVLLVNGRMEGIWRHEIKGSRLEVVVEPFVRAAAWVRRAAGARSRTPGHVPRLHLEPRLEELTLSTVLSPACCPIRGRQPAPAPA
jgi:hypothetical protein